MTRFHAHLDAATRLWWRGVGRRVDLTGAHAWLAAPMAGGATVRDRWLTAAARELDASLPVRTPIDGLLPSLAVLDGPGFAHAEVAAPIHDFYARTASWRMEAWSQWSPLLAPGGALIEALFGRRVGQLALPVRPLEVSRGIDSEVQVFRDRDGAQLGAAWLRRLRSTGDFLFSGFYRVTRLPGADRPSVHVSFPLEQGNVQVFLRPEVGPGGSLLLHSPRGRFGGDGAYVVVRFGRDTWAARLPLHERFHVFEDAEGVLRTDHDLALGRARAMRLHYRLEPRDGSGCRPSAF